MTPIPISQHYPITLLAKDTFMCRMSCSICIFYPAGNYVSSGVHNITLKCARMLVARHLTSLPLTKHGEQSSYCVNDHNHLYQCLLLGDVFSLTAVGSFGHDESIEEYMPSCERSGCSQLIGPQIIEAVISICPEITYFTRAFYEKATWDAVLTCKSQFRMFWVSIYVFTEVTYLWILLSKAQNDI